MLGKTSVALSLASKIEAYANLTELLLAKILP